MGGDDTVRRVPAAPELEAELDRMQKVLSDWWLERAKQEIEQVVPKAVEYGANSMIEVGRTLARLQHRTVTDEEAIELACMFYIAGKVGRWVDAVAANKRVSDDTLHDIGVYVRMAQRNRDVGGWPFGPDEDK